MPAGIALEVKAPNVPRPDDPGIKDVGLVPVVPVFWKIKVKGNHLSGQPLRLNYGEHNSVHAQIPRFASPSDRNEEAIAFPSVESWLARHLDRLASELLPLWKSCGDAICFRLGCGATQHRQSEYTYDNNASHSAQLFLCWENFPAKQIIVDKLGMFS